MIVVRFFAAYRERLDCEQLELDAAEITVDALRAQLSEKGDVWRDIMNSRRTIVAVNQSITKEDVTLTAGDEIAFFPPVTGG